MTAAPATAAATVYVVDDEPGVCRGLQATLRGAGLGCRTFTSFQSFARAYDPAGAGCLVMDIRMPGMSGLEGLEELRRRGIPIPVIVMTGQGGVRTAVDSLKLGASDFLEKPIHPDALVAAVRAGLARDDERRRRDGAIDRIVQRLGGLTRRERTLLGLIVAGRSNKLMAEELDLSIKTVINTRANLMDKMGAGNMADLVRMALTADPSLSHPAPAPARKR